MVKLFGGDGLQLQAQLCIWNGNLTWKNQSKSATEPSYSLASVGTYSHKFTLRVEIVSGVVTMYVKDADNGNTISTFTQFDGGVTVNNLTNAGFFFNYDTPLTASEEWSITNIEVKPLTNA